MKHTTIITSIDLYGVVEGLARLILPEEIRPRRLWALVMPPESALVTGDDEVQAHYQAGSPVIRELWLERVEPWTAAPPGRRSLRQRGGAATTAQGKVVEITGTKSYRLACDPIISVVCPSRLPTAGQTVRVGGTLICRDSDDTD